ncbi:hypothetical protein KJ885_02510 [Patescibacteria group bacterium]|nr:hypothetical protein [Patescibacteria group bacterium]
MLNKKKKIKKKKGNVSKQEIDRTLKSIYRDEAGNKIDMKIRKVKKQTNARKILIGLIVFFALISAVSWLGIFIFSRWSGSGLENLNLDIAGKEQVVAGDEVEYKIKYENKEDIPLASAEIGLYLPKSFVISESEPTLDDKNKLKIGTLKSNEGGVIKFKGKFFATEGSKEVIQIVLSYKPSNFNSKFETVASLEVEIAGSIFDGSLDGPDVSVVGDSVVYKMTYKNKSEDELENVAIDAVLPSDFIISTSTPQIGKKNRWDIGKLEGKGEGEVAIKGIFSSESKGNKDIVFKLGVLDEDGAFLTLIEKKITTNVVGGDLVTTVMINGMDNFSTVRWGESLNYSITYENAGKNDLHDVELKMNIIGLPKEKGQSIVNWDSLSDSNGGKKKDDSIVWTKNEIKKLATIKSGEEGTIDFSISVISKPTNPSYQDYKVDSQLEAEVARVGNVAVKRILQSKKITTFINSDAEFISMARYYDENNTQIGFGPIPPKVGQKTTYKIYWKVINSMHELDEMRIVGNLPEGVVFSNGAADAGTIALDSSLKKVEWTLNRMPTSVNTISAEFNVIYTPSSGDAGSVAGLLEQIEFSAKDKSTGGIITIKQGDETTSLPDDPYVTAGEVVN